MKKRNNFTPLQTGGLVLLRLLIGWHLLYEGFSKLLVQDWTSAGFLQESKWILAGFSQWIIAHNNVLNIVDLLNTWGLIAIGLGLILGFFTRIASISGAVLLVLYYLTNVPLIGLEYTIPVEGNYLIVNKTLIESVTLFVLALFPTGLVFGVDSFIFYLKNKKLTRI